MALSCDQRGKEMDLLLWSRLNLLSLPKERQSELAEARVPLEAVEYGKEEGHWDGQKLLEQVGKKALPIAIRDISSCFSLTTIPGQPHN